MKMKNLLYSALLSILCFTSCKKDDEIYTPSLPGVSIENITGSTSVAQEDTIYLKAKINSVSASQFKWKVNGEQVTNATDSIFKFVKNALGDYTVSLSCTNIDGEVSAKVEINVYGKYRHGTFILNEGNMTTENGSLVFISPKGIVTDSVYWKVNGTALGNGSQDIFIVNRKIYIISQNGRKNPAGTVLENDGMLIVANSETLQKETIYNDELATLSWPTHVAVLGQDNVFIRDNKGVYLFNTSSKELKLILGTTGALKNRMAVTEGKVFAPAGKSVLVLEAGKDSISHKIEMGAAISGVIKSSDGNIWVSTTGTPHKITKINSKDYTVIKANDITEAKIGAGWGATPGISAKGDTLYFSNASTKIYRHIFSSGTTDFMLDAKTLIENANMVYNNLAVHPITGEVYLNTIKGYGLNFLINSIGVFNFSGAEPQLSTNYLNHTHFPAGIYFTYDFE